MPLPEGSGFGSSRQASGIAASPIGRLMKNTQRQPSSGPNSAMSAPPSNGPTAVDTPMIVPKRPKAIPVPGR
ncbi:hypothetical protein U6N30_15305 [Blastococcus brunescens]|uniref:Uncharacterized protein n=1 Tax=Blastococcus brunescens TaxID=1564165 RepID=A0ABZ1B745_9ACTN|nr:hypothetical protein [Blastococcus sp. BMG 8361]WRL66637.1 hypothetical protein U6N30_15305 [Blastococcus sp. BMG 8361]